MSYIDNLMTNHPLDTNESDQLLSISSNINYDSIGGYNDNNNNGDSKVPNGGFPPIYLVSRENTEKEVASKNRQFGTVKSAISIKDLLGKKIDTSK